MKFLKIASCIVSEWLSKFFNKCMTTGEFLDSWKKKLIWGNAILVSEQPMSFTLSLWLWLY